MISTPAIRPFQQGDLPFVLHLLTEVLGETQILKRSPELFRWKHLDNPFGRSIMLVAEDSGGIVGFRALMRWELMTQSGELLKCARPVDTAIHPRARRRGVFRRLTEIAIESARGDGVELIFNTPNSQSRPGYLKMGWDEVGRIGVMIRPLRIAMRGTNSFPEVREASKWGEREPTDRAPLGLRTPRSVNYLKWRFGLHPTAPYSVTKAPNGSLAVVRSNVRAGRGELVVSDLFGDKPAWAIRRVVRRTDAAYLAGWAPRHAPERRQLLAAGLVPLPGATALTLVARALGRPGVDVTRLSNWDLAPSDLELL